MLRVQHFCEFVLSATAAAAAAAAAAASIAASTPIAASTMSLSDAFINFCWLM